MDRTFTLLKTSMITLTLLKHWILLNDIETHKTINTYNNQIIVWNFTVNVCDLMDWLDSFLGVLSESVHSVITWLRRWCLPWFFGCYFS